MFLLVKTQTCCMHKCSNKMHRVSVIIYRIFFLSFVLSFFSFFHSFFLSFLLSFVYILSPQDWLSASARKVSLAGRPMEWVTPLGLPVVQPYHKMYQKSVSLPPIQCDIIISTTLFLYQCVFVSIVCAEGYTFLYIHHLRFISHHPTLWSVYLPRALMLCHFCY